MLYRNTPHLWGEVAGVSAFPHQHDGLLMIKNAEDVVKAIDEGYKKESKEKARDYIGASGIGTQCDAYQAYSLRGFPNDTIQPKLKRIFKLGHILEDIVVKDIKEKADVRVWEVDGLTG